MTARSIGEIVSSIVKSAIGMANLQDWISDYKDPADKKVVIMELWDAETITREEAELLIKFNGLESV